MAAPLLWLDAPATFKTDKLSNHTSNVLHYLQVIMYFMITKIPAYP